MGVRFSTIIFQSDKFFGNSSKSEVKSNFLCLSKSNPKPSLDAMSGEDNIAAIARLGVGSKILSLGFIVAYPKFKISKHEINRLQRLGSNNCFYLQA